MLVLIPCVRADFQGRQLVSGVSRLGRPAPWQMGLPHRPSPRNPGPATADGLLAQEIRAAGLIHSAPFNYRADVIGALHTHFANICDIADAFAAMFTVPRGAGRSPLFCGARRRAT